MPKFGVTHHKIHTYSTRLVVSTPWWRYRGQFLHLSGWHRSLLSVKERKKDFVPSLVGVISSSRHWYNSHAKNSSWRTIYGSGIMAPSTEAWTIKVASSVKMPEPQKLENNPPSLASDIHPSGLASLSIGRCGYVGGTKTPSHHGG